MRTHTLSLSVLSCVAAVAFGSQSLWTSPLGAALVPTVIFSEDWSAPPPPAKFTFSGGGTSTVSAGTLKLTKLAGSNPLYVSTETFTDPQFTVETDLGTFGDAGYDPGNVTYGLVIGNRSFGSFIGFGTGLWSVVDLSSGVQHGYINMGFTSPNNGTLHHIKVDVDTTLSQFVFTFTNTTTLQTYTSPPFILAGFAPGGVGYFTAFPGSGGLTSTGVFDNLEVIALREEVFVPEPSTLVLLGLGVVGLAIQRCRRRRMAA